MWMWAALLILSNARANSIDDVYVRQLIRARSGHELLLSKDTFDSLKVSRLACRLQIERGFVPVGCYDRLHREKDWEGIDSSGPKVSELDRRCRMAARAFRLPHAKADLAHLSPTCRSFVDRARLVVAYRRELPPEWSEEWSED